MCGAEGSQRIGTHPTDETRASSTFPLVLTGSRSSAKSQAQPIASPLANARTDESHYQISDLGLGVTAAEHPGRRTGADPRSGTSDRRRSTVLFSSPLFLFGFLPILLGLYAVTGPRLRNLLLLVASLLFYTWGEGTYVFVMIAIIAINYGLGRLVGSLDGGWPCKAAVALAVTVNLGLLIVFKYSNFLVDQLNTVLAIVHVTPVKLDPVHLPLGISFFTFHALSYVIDVSRRAARAPGHSTSHST